MMQTHNCVFSAASRLIGAISSISETKGGNGGTGKPNGYSNAGDGVKDATNVTGEFGGVLRTTDS